MGLCNSINILRQDIQTLPVICKAMCAIGVVRVLTANKFKNYLKSLDKIS